MTTNVQFGEAYARSTDPGTSHAAAKAIRGNDTVQAETRVLVSLILNPQGLTTHEIAIDANMEYGTVTPRMKPMVRKGLVVDSGLRRIPSGRTKAGIVWKAVEKGVA